MRGYGSDCPFEPPSKPRWRGCYWRMAAVDHGQPRRCFSCSCLPLVAATLYYHPPLSSRDALRAALPCVRAALAPNPLITKSQNAPTPCRRILRRLALLRTCCGTWVRPAACVFVGLRWPGLLRPSVAPPPPLRRANCVCEHNAENNSRCTAAKALATLWLSLLVSLRPPRVLLTRTAGCARWMSCTCT